MSLWADKTPYGISVNNVMNFEPRNRHGTNCTCPIYFVWWIFLVCYRIRVGISWGSITDKILLYSLSHFVLAEILHVPKNRPNPFAKGPFSEVKYLIICMTIIPYLLSTLWRRVYPRLVHYWLNSKSWACKRMYGYLKRQIVQFFAADMKLGYFANFSFCDLKNTTKKKRKYPLYGMWRVNNV